MGNKKVLFSPIVSWSIIIVLFVLVIVGCEKVKVKLNEDCKIEKIDYIITDIVERNNNFLPDDCIFDTDKGKLSFVSDSICNLQIGDTITKKIYVSGCFTNKDYEFY